MRIYLGEWISIIGMFCDHAKGIGVWVPVLDMCMGSPMGKLANLRICVK
jgi:hypothetical protein